MLNNKTKYALKALLTLASTPPEGLSQIADLAAKDNIPQKFLEAILVDLKRAGFIESKRGKNGGYYLLKAPHEVKIGEVIRLFNGPLALLPCASKSRPQKCDDCTDDKFCNLRFLMCQVRDMTAQLLDNTSLADMQYDGKTLGFYSI